MPTLTLALLFVLAAVASSLSTRDKLSCIHNVTFFGPWAGGDAWLVNYTGPFLNDRPPHVQVGKSQYKNHTQGELWCLTNCRAATKSAIEWDLPGCYNSALPADSTCHITVYYGPNAQQFVSKYCA